RILLLLLASFGSLAYGLVDESDLPVYLQGIGWKNVEAELRKDLRLSPYVRPLHYELRFNVSVAGYGGAKLSTYDGTVFISFNITESVKEIEIHSLGLTISDVNLNVIESNEKNSLNDGKFHVRGERESIAIPSKRPILPEDDVTLMIAFNGTAR
ncbi:hypothetical protein PMAYCL1PPCAC_31394, partial [Pristionchus mayeri]